MSKTRRAKDGDPNEYDPSQAMFACPNPDCDLFNRFGVGNLSVCERMGKDKSIRRLYCDHCQCRFSERQGSLMQYAKLPEPTVVRIIKCLGYGCTVEATGDICEVDPRTIERILARAGRRAEDFHRLQLEKLEEPLEAVQLDELHGRVCKPPATKEAKKGANDRSVSLLRRVAEWVGHGFMPPWR